MGWDLRTVPGGVHPHTCTVLPKSRRQEKGLALLPPPSPICKTETSQLQNGPPACRDRWLRCRRRLGCEKVCKRGWSWTCQPWAGARAPRGSGPAPAGGRRCPLEAQDAKPPGQHGATSQAGAARPPRAPSVRPPPSACLGVVLTSRWNHPITPTSHGGTPRSQGVGTGTP